MLIIEYLKKEELIKGGKLFLTLLVFFQIFLSFLYPVHSIKDTDIFWHLKIGEIIFQDRFIPDKDPFTHTPKDPLRESNLMSSYWLSELILFVLYKTVGFKGPVIFISILIVLTIFFVHASIRKRGFFLSISLCLLLSEILKLETLLKPNVFSFFFLAAVVFCIEKYRALQERRYQIALILSIVLWANCHGAHIMGIVILIMYLCLEVLVYAFQNKESRDIGRLKRLVPTLLIAICSGLLIRPSGIRFFYQMVHHLLLDRSYRQVIDSGLIGELPLFMFMNYFADNRFFLVFILTGVILIFTLLNLLRRKSGVIEATVVFSLFAYSIFTVRAVSLFLIAGLIIAGGKEAYGFPFIKKIKNNFAPFFFLFFVAITIFMLIRTFPVHFSGELRETRYMHLRLGEFLEKNDIKGNMLNDVVTGNYIIFKLFPKYKVFIDSRNLNFDVYFDLLNIFSSVVEKSDIRRPNDYKILTGLCENELNNRANRTSYSEEYWYRLLESYDIDYIVGRVTHVISGAIKPVFLKLLYLEEWKLVYMDGNGVILIKDNGKNDDILRKYLPIDKKLLFKQALLEGHSVDRRYMGYASETIAFSLLNLGKHEDAYKYASLAYSMGKQYKIAGLVYNFLKDDYGDR